MMSSQIPESDSTPDQPPATPGRDETVRDRDEQRNAGTHSYGEGVFGQGERHAGDQHGQGVFEQGHAEPDGEGVFDQGHPDPPEEGEAVFDQDRPDEAGTQDPSGS